MPNIFVLAIILSVAVTVLLMVYAIVKHTVEKSFFLILLSIANLFFVFGNLLEITASTMEAAFYGIRVQYMGAPFLLPLTYLFYREFYGKKRFTPTLHVLLFLIPVLSMLALQEFPLVQLHYKDIWYSNNGYIASIQHTDGITYYLGTALNYICIILSLRLIIKGVIRGSKMQRKQSTILLAGWLAPLVTNVSFVFLGGDNSYDLTPITYVTSMAVLLYAALVHNLLDVLPLARAQVIDELEDAFIVCDEKLNFLDANLSARRLFPELSAMTQGESMENIQRFRTEGELRMVMDGEESIYKITANPILHGTKNSGICVVFRNVTVENRLLRHLQQQATMDGLTGIYNRNTFFDIARETQERGKSKKLDYALLMIDLDHFKKVNDTYGHPCGDAVLKAVANTLKEHFREGDVCGRYGGEEFAVLLENLSDTQAVTAAEKLRKTIEAMEIDCQNQKIRATISIGVTHYRAGEEQTLESMLTQADEALYLSKSKGRNQTSLYRSGEEDIQ